jgi:hypothetical protein
MNVHSSPSGRSHLYLYQEKTIVHCASCLGILPTLRWDVCAFRTLLSAMSAFKADVIAPSGRLYEIRTNAFLYIKPKHEGRPIPQERDSVLHDYGYHKPLALTGAHGLSSVANVRHGHLPKGNRAGQIADVRPPSIHPDVASSLTAVAKVTLSIIDDCRVSALLYSLARVVSGRNDGFPTRLVSE